MTTNQIWIHEQTVANFLLDMRAGARVNLLVRADPDGYDHMEWLTVVDHWHMTKDLQDAAEARGFVVRDEAGTAWILLRPQSPSTTATASPWNGWPGEKNGYVCFHEATETSVIEFFPTIPD